MVCKICLSHLLSQKYVTTLCTWKKKRLFCDMKTFETKLNLFVLLDYLWALFVYWNCTLLCTVQTQDRQSRLQEFKGLNMLDFKM